MKGGTVSERRRLITLLEEIRGGGGSQLSNRAVTLKVPCSQRKEDPHFVVIINKMGGLPRKKTFPTAETRNFCTGRILKLSPSSVITAPRTIRGGVREDRSVETNFRKKSLLAWDGGLASTWSAVQISCKKWDRQEGDAVERKRRSLKQNEWALSGNAGKLASTPRTGQKTKRG